MPSRKTYLLLLLTFSLSGCFNDNHERRLDLGDVSLGDQLIDLKKAHEAEAISDREYQQLRKGLIAIITEQKASDDGDTSEKIEEEEEDGFSWL